MCSVFALGLFRGVSNPGFFSPFGQLLQIHIDGGFRRPVEDHGDIGNGVVDATRQRYSASA